jgi:hypothetical protein
LGLERYTEFGLPKAVLPSTFNRTGKPATPLLFRFCQIKNPPTHTLKEYVAERNIDWVRCSQKIKIGMQPSKWHLLQNISWRANDGKGLETLT